MTLPVDNFYSESDYPSRLFKRPLSTKEGLYMILRVVTLVLSLKQSRIKASGVDILVQVFYPAAVPNAKFS